MQKIKIGHPAKFQDKDNFFPLVFCPVCVILCRIFTSSVLRVQPFDTNLIHSADACFLFMACVGLHVHMKPKTISSLLNEI